MLSRSAQSISNGFNFVLRAHPISLVYMTSLHRRSFYRLAKVYAFVYIFDLFRSPYMNKKLLEKTELEQQTQEEDLSQILQKVDLKLSDFKEDYFVIITATSNPEKQSQLEDKQKILFEINNLINKKIEMQNQIFSDIKFLFIGSEQIYKIAQVNNTIIEFYEKEKEKKQEAGIYILARQNDNEEKLIHARVLKPDIRSIMNAISKHKARKFASSMQF